MISRKARVERRGPDQAWQALARSIVEECKERLWSEEGQSARRFLMANGLTEETLKQTRLGFCPADTDYQGVHVDRGITIPWFVGRQLWQVNVRTDERDKPKYRPLAGSMPALYGINSLKDKRECIVSSTEFEALLLRQELGSSLGTVSAGITFSGQLDDRFLRVLLAVNCVWIVTGRSLDTSVAGSKWLSLVGERGHLIRLPGPADTASDVLTAGNGFEGWLDYHRARVEGYEKWSAIGRRRGTGTASSDATPLP